MTRASGGRRKKVWEEGREETGRRQHGDHGKVVGGRRGVSRWEHGKKAGEERKREETHQGQFHNKNLIIS